MEASVILSGRDKQLYHLSGKALEGNYRLMIDVQLSMSSSYDEKGKSLNALKNKEVRIPEMMNALMAMLHPDVDLEYKDQCIIFVHRLDQYITPHDGAFIKDLRICMLGPSEMTPLTMKAEYEKICYKKLVDLVEALDNWWFEIPQYILMSYHVVGENKAEKVVRIYPISKISQNKMTTLRRQKQSDRDKANNLKKTIETCQDQLQMIENPRQADRKFFGHELEENTYTICLDGSKEITGRELSPGLCPVM